MLRAVRFAEKLGFVIAPETASQIHHLAHLLKDIPPARLFEESNKLFLSGAGHNTFLSLQRYELFAPLYPQTAEQLAGPQGQKTQQLLELAMQGTDSRVNQERPVSPAFINAALLWHSVQGMANHFIERGEPKVPAFQQAISIVLGRQAQSVSIPKHFTSAMREIWSLQVRFEQRKNRKTRQLLEQKRFRAAYDLLLLRAKIGEIDNQLAEWWTVFQTADEQEQNAMINREQRTNPKAGRRRKRPSRNRRKQAQKPSDS
jgi:poly(A) polymerase